MNRFRIERRSYSHGEYGLLNGEEVELQVSVPYKNCFGNIKRTYKTIHTEPLTTLARHSIISEKEIIDFLLKKYQAVRNEQKNLRNLRRKFNHGTK